MDEDDKNKWSCFLCFPRLLNMKHDRWRKPAPTRFRVMSHEGVLVTADIAELNLPTLLSLSSLNELFPFYMAACWSDAQQVWRYTCCSCLLPPGAVSKPCETSSPCATFLPVLNWRDCLCFKSAFFLKKKITDIFHASPSSWSTLL